MVLTDIDRGIKDLNSGWLGTDPLRNDSDDHYWSGAQLLTQSRRDGIIDGGGLFQHPLVVMQFSIQILMAGMSTEMARLLRHLVWA